MMRRTRARRTERVDGGFTLIEVLITTAVVAVIAGSITAAFAVIVRVAPTTELRIDDARSTRALATYLSHDTTSAPPYENEIDGDGAARSEGGIIVDTSLANPNNDDCGVGSASNINVLHLQWVESGTNVETFVANYRFVTDGTEGSVYRYTCSRVGAGAFSTPVGQEMTAGLDPSVVPAMNLLIDADGEAYSVEFTLTAPSGETVTIETGSRNPVEYYS